MNPLFLLIAGIFAMALAAAAIWALRGTPRRFIGPDAMKVIGDAPKHLRSMMQIRQALNPADLEYLSKNGGKFLASTVRRERRRVARLYLEAIRADFEQALHLARVIAVLSPELSSADEYQRLKLSLVFRVRYQVVRVRIQTGSLDLPQVAALGQMVTSLVGELEAAMAALGERASLVAGLAAQSDQ